jgi:hypothetical protein
MNYEIFRAIRYLLPNSRWATAVAVLSAVCISVSIIMLTGSAITCVLYPCSPHDLLLDAIWIA